VIPPLRGYHWLRRHKTIKMTPPKLCALVDKQWSIFELLERVA
jgi:hypothetical protein